MVADDVDVGGRVAVAPHVPISVSIEVEGIVRPFCDVSYRRLKASRR